MSLGTAVLVVVVAFVPVALALLALWDIPRWPAAAWADVGRSRSTWMVVSLVAVLIGPLWYLVSVRPALERAGSGDGR